jgi:hypothetical protein
MVLGDSRITSSDDLRALFTEITAGIAAADQSASTERGKSLDPATTPQEAEAATSARWHGGVKGAALSHRAAKRLTVNRPLKP